MARNHIRKTTYNKNRIFRKKKGDSKMLRKLFLFLALTVFTLGVIKLSFAMMCGGHDKHQRIAQAETEHKHEATEATDAGNKICPVSGEKIDEKMKATYEYKSKIYNFCCSMCIDMFKKDPEKYIKKVEEELQAKPKEEAMPQHMHEGHPH